MIDEIVETKWLPTPYMNGQCCPHRGVDCVNFVVAILDQLHGYPEDFVFTNPIPKIAGDASIHNPKLAIDTVRAIVKRYPSRLVRPHEELEPCDVIIVRPSDSSGPGHVLIIADDALSAWHSQFRSGVCKTAVSAIGRREQVWRPTERHTWHS